MLKNLEKCLGALSSCYRRSAIYDKERYSLDAQLATFIDLFGYFFRAGNAI
jgi:hypothetical protein